MCEETNHVHIACYLRLMIAILLKKLRHAAVDRQEVSSHSTTVVTQVMDWNVEDNFEMMVTRRRGIQSSPGQIRPTSVKSAYRS
jgi:hypothetical protein